MKLKTIGDDNEITLEEYSDGECRRIFIDRNSYVIECIHNYGDDYGGSHCSEERETSYEEIIPERILVKDGEFCGVSILTEYDYYNGGGKVYYNETLLLLDGSGDNNARSGYSFSNDDHSRWSYTDYYLVPRPRDL